MSNSRVEEIEKSLETDVYRKIEALENLRDDTISSTEKLVDILDGYMTKLEDIEIEEDITTMEVVVDKEIDIEVEDDDMLREYNEQIHDFGLETLTELLSKDEKEKIDSNNKIDFDNEEINQIIDEIDDYKTQELETQGLATEEFTQTLDSSDENQIEIEDIDLVESTPKPMVETLEESNKEKELDKEKKQKVKKRSTNRPKKKATRKKAEVNPVDRVLTIILVIVVIFFLFSMINL